MKAWSVCRLASFVPLGLAAATLVACGNGPAASLTSPSRVPGGPAGVLTGTVVTGDGSSSTAGVGGGAGFHTMRKAAPGVTITVVGTGLTVTTAADGSFVIDGVPADTAITLQFSGPGVNATLTLGTLNNGQVLHITVRVNGTSAALDDEGEGDGSQEKEEIEGIIGAIAVAPPSITVNSQVISVPAGTPIRHGSTSFTFADLAVGDRVHVKAHRIGAVLTAMEVNLQQGAATPGKGKGDEEEDEEEEDGPGNGKGHH